MRQNLNEVIKLNEEEDDNKNVLKITQERLKYLSTVPRIVKFQHLEMLVLSYIQ